MDNTMNLITGFDNHDYDNWFNKRYEFIDLNTNQKFYTTQHEYHTLKKQSISDYNYDVQKNPYNINNNTSYTSYIKGLLNLKIY